MFAHLLPAFSTVAAQVSSDSTGSNGNNGNNIAFAALIWWVIPAGAVIGAIVYVVWVSKFQDKYSNETNRSVNSFNRFQASFRDPKDSSERINPAQPKEPPQG